MVMQVRGWVIDIHTATGATDTATGAMETGGAIPWAMVCARTAERGVMSGLRWGGGAVRWGGGAVRWGGGAVGWAELAWGTAGGPAEATRSCCVTGRGCIPALLRVV